MPRRKRTPPKPPGCEAEYLDRDSKPRLCGSPISMNSISGRFCEAHLRRIREGTMSKHQEGKDSMN